MEHRPLPGDGSEAGKPAPAPRPDLNALLLFYDTVNAGSINRAARNLGIPKSTISRKLSLLEQQFGAALVKRGPRSLGLTEIGTALYQRCERIAGELEGASAQTSEMQSGISGVLRISMPAFLLPAASEVVADFAGENPALRMEIEAHNRWVDVVEEPFDVAIQLGRPVDSSASMRRLAELGRSVFATPDYIERKGVPRSASDLADHDLIMHQYQQRDRVWPDLAPRAGTVVSSPVRAVTNHAIMVKSLVGRGLGIGLLPDLMCAEDLAEGRLMRLPVLWDCPPLLVYATFLERRYATHKTRSFLDLFAAYLREPA